MDCQRATKGPNQLIKELTGDLQKSAGAEERRLRRSEDWWGAIRGQQRLTRDQYGPSGGQEKLIAG